MTAPAIDFLQKLPDLKELLPLMERNPFAALLLAGFVVVVIRVWRGRRGGRDD